jgi:rhodanese-related sulfurtransferase
MTATDNPKAAPPAPAEQTPWPALLIGLTGPAGAGKTTVAQHLQAEYAFSHLAFADPICDMLYALFAAADVPAAWMTERALKEQPSTLGYSYRHLAQTLGTEWGRALHPDFWTRILVQRLLQPRLAGDNLVVSDVRFANEAAELRLLGAVIVQVQRPGAALPAVRPHASEAGLPATAQPDYVLHNSGSLQQLHWQVDDLIANLRSTHRPTA